MSLPRLLTATLSVAWAGWALFLGLGPGRRVVGLGEAAAEPLQHIVVFGMLGALVALSLPDRTAAVMGVLAAAGLAGEIAQLGAADRGVSLGDAAVNVIGAALGVGAVAAWPGTVTRFLAVVLAASLVVASPLLLVEHDANPGPSHPAGCIDPPPPLRRPPRIVLDSGDLSAQELPLRLDAPSAADLRRAVMATDELTAEIWFTTDDLGQSGPARLFTVSRGPAVDQGSFHLGIDADDLSVRIRNACDDFNWVLVDDVVLAGAPQHALVTWRGGILDVWVNGRFVSRTTIEYGELDAWDPDHLVLVGDEFGGGRSFDGIVHSVTVWDGVLDADTIAERSRLRPVTVP